MEAVLGPSQDLVSFTKILSTSGYLCEQQNITVIGQQCHFFNNVVPESVFLHILIRNVNLVQDSIHLSVLIYILIMEFLIFLTRAYSEQKNVL